MSLDGIRREIDRVDEQMKELFLKRMDLSRQVIGEKKLTGAAVYAPERELEVLASRTKGAREEYLPECRAFFGTVMEISRTYQYSRLASQAEVLETLPQGEGSVEISFSCEKKSRQPAVFLNAAALAGFCIEEAKFWPESGQMRCRFRMSGDFSPGISKAAVRQMLEENDSIRIAVL